MSTGITDRHIRFGVEQAGTVTECDGEADARAQITLNGGILVAREWVSGGWAEVK